MNPISAMRSASSKTAISTFSKEIEPCSIKSINLPGHATTMSTPFSSALLCLEYEVPPYTASTLRCISFASGVKTLQICSANSLVGVTINELGLPGSEGLHLAIRGKPKAKVLPDPVGALQQISLPSRVSGIAAC